MLSFGKATTQWVDGVYAAFKKNTLVHVLQCMLHVCVYTCINNILVHCVVKKSIQMKF